MDLKINLDAPLPCDVMVPPRTLIRKGCKLSTLLEAMRHREGQTPDRTMFAERAAVSLKAPSDGDSNG